MENSDLLCPPENVRGMKVLDRDAFKKTVTVCCLEIQQKHIKVLIQLLKKYFLKIKGMKTFETTGSNNQKLLFNPHLIKKFDDFPENIQAKFKSLELKEMNFGKTCINLVYDNWKADCIIKAILPKNEPPLRGYSLVGHIIHLNIKDNLLEYKHIIAQILLDKVPVAKTVVYKKNIIDNIYRNFEMEVLCGEHNFIVCTVEFGVKFEFDFSKVYWNPRLSTEHDRILNELQSNDVLFDVFAGVGPFSIRAALKKCYVFANDLNPDSFKWLNHNIELNKKSKNYITTFNKDGSEFILNDVKNNLLKVWKNSESYGKIHVVMNLPATALHFLKYFKELITEKDLQESEITEIEKCLPIIIHCYFFVKQPFTEKEVFEMDSGIEFNENNHKFYFVRNVSNGKAMTRVTFEMPVNEILQRNTDFDEPLNKRIRTN